MMSTKVFEKDRQQVAQERPLQPLSLPVSVVLFAVPTVVIFLAFQIGLPMMEAAGLSQLQAFIVAMTVPMALLFTAAMVGYARVEGRPLTWAAFSERMRFPRLTWKDLGRGLLVFLAGAVAAGIFGAVTLKLIESGLIPLPKYLPLLLDPFAKIDLAALDTIAGGAIAGRWDLVLGYAVAVFFNIAGEELWWRGFILPRQELTHGRSTWLIHGILWTLMHAFKWWQLIAVLPLALIFAYSAQRYKNNWPVTIAHTLGNLSYLVIIILAVAGG